MREALADLQKETLSELANCADLDVLAELRQKVLGRKGGALTQILKGLGGLAPEERKEMGMASNEVKEVLNRAFEEREKELLQSKPLLSFDPDLSLPGKSLGKGGLHPITQMCYDLNDAFRSLNFDLVEDVEISSDQISFGNLNFPDNHPARESMDTYWLEGSAGKASSEKLCLRPHLTGSSVRYLQKHGAPARFVYPGFVYRNETTDARHERAFFQYEALIVEEDFSFASGQLLIETILEKVFGHPIKTRMRAGFFPFVEPGFEIDMECQVCKGEGCRVCQHVGWIEVMPGGTPHPNVLRAAGLDPEKWTGFYINIGLDRLVMMRYGVNDVRHFHSADLRFLQQFK